MAYEDTIHEKGAVNETLIPGIFKVKRASDPAPVHAAGAREAFDSIPGKASISGSIDFSVDPTLAVIVALILSDVDGLAQQVTVDDGEGAYTAYFNNAKISVPAHDIVTASMGWDGTAKAASSLPVGDPVLSDPFMGTNVVLTGFPATFDWESLDLNIKAAFNSKYSARGTSRLPAHLAPGYLDVDGEIKFNEDPGIDVLAASLAKVATATIAIKSASGAKTWTITLTDVRFGENPREGEEQNSVNYPMKFIARLAASAVA